VTVTYGVAVRGEERKIYDLLMLMYEETGIASLSKAKVANEIDRLMDEGVIFVAREGESIVATMGVGPSQFWYSDDWHIQDSWLFVKKGYRRSRHALVIMKAVKKFAKSAHLPLAVGVFAPKGVERKNKLFSFFKHYNASLTCIKISLPAEVFTPYFL